MLFIFIVYVIFFACFFFKSSIHLFIYVHIQQE